MKRILIALSLLPVRLIAVPRARRPWPQGQAAHGRGHGPNVIQLPNGFGPEGIATCGARHVLRLAARHGRDLPRLPQDRARRHPRRGRHGRRRHRHEGRPPRAPVRLRRRQRSRSASTTPARARDPPLRGARPRGFINDVIVTRQAAYFTDSQPSGPVRDPDRAPRRARRAARAAAHAASRPAAGRFNANGIEATRDGRTLIIVKSNTGELFTADAATGATKKIDRTAATASINGDGILLKGRKLYVRREPRRGRGRASARSAVKLRRDGTGGRVVDEITDADFDVPTTIAALGRAAVRGQRQVRPGGDPGHGLPGGEGPEAVSYSTSRRSTAQRLSSWRLESCSLRSTADTCASTVLAEIPRRSAISL